MPIKLENVGIAIRDIEEAIAFFTDLGLALVGRDTVSGEWTDTAVGLDGNHAKIAMLQTPDGHGLLELFEYIHPDAIESQPTRPNDIGMHLGRLLGRRPRCGASRGRQARLLPIARRGHLRGHLQAHLRARPERDHRHACRGTQQALTPAARPC